MQSAGGAVCFLKLASFLIQASPTECVSWGAGNKRPQTGQLKTTGTSLPPLELEARDPGLVDDDNLEEGDPRPPVRLSQMPVALSLTQPAEASRVLHTNHKVLPGNFPSPAFQHAFLTSSHLLGGCVGMSCHRDIPLQGWTATAGVGGWSVPRSSSPSWGHKCEVGPRAGRW